jgi:hypothetical protein
MSTNAVPMRADRAGVRRWPADRLISSLPAITLLQAVADRRLDDLPFSLARVGG